MKADEDSVVLIGRALEPLDNSEGTISAFIQITTSNSISNINNERLLEEDDSKIGELEGNYKIDLKDIREEKAKQKTRLERVKEKLLANATISSTAIVAPAPQIDYMEKVNGSVIIRLG